jgi:hypothetical protein
MTDVAETLDRLAPIAGWEDDWADVLSRLGEDGRPLPAPRRGYRLRIGHRRTVVLAFILLAIVMPLTAVSAINHWWTRAYLPRPGQQPIVVSRGSWSGHRWTLVAYPSHPGSNGYGLCWGVTFSRSPRLAAVATGRTVPPATMALQTVKNSIGCDSIVGIAKRYQAPGLTPTVISQESVNQTTPANQPAWISGVVVANATNVVIRWSAKKARPPALLKSPSEIVRAATFPAAVAGYHVRLFAAPLPKPIARHTRKATAWTLPSSITGTNNHGHVVACSSLASGSEASPLSSCKP